MTDTTNTYISDPAGAMEVDIKWLAFLLLLLASAYLMAINGLSLEIAQNILFIPIILAVDRIFRSFRYRLPRLLLVFACISWISSSLSVRGYLPSYIYKPGAYLSVLENDVGEQSARDILRRYNFIARVYSAPRMKFVQRKFENSNEANKWLDNEGQAAVLVSGETDWPRLSFRSGLLSSFTDLSSSSGILLAELEMLGLANEKDIRVISFPWLDFPLVVVLAPEELVISGEPADLSRHFMVWLTRGLLAINPNDPIISVLRESLVERPKEVTEEFFREQELALKHEALFQATQMHGQWLSPAALAAGNFFLGTSELLMAIGENSVQKGYLDAAISSLNLAIKRFRKNHDGELHAAALNNLAVARYLVADSNRDVEKLLRNFDRAASLRKSNGQPTRGARVALLNLISLQRSLPVN